MAAQTTALMDAKKCRDTTVRYEVRRERSAGREGAARPPAVEVFLSLDRARLAALGYALDGVTTSTGDRFTGVVQIVMVVRASAGEVGRRVIDVIDERVAFRLLNDVRLPQAGQLALSVDQLQRKVDAIRVS